MTEDELRALCAAEESAALGGTTGTLSEQRRRALSYYLGEPFGNEEDGRSQVVTTEVADTVEWILPALMKIFTAGSEVGRFEPTGPEDEETAQQATDYCNWVLNQKNPGFLILHDLFKDGLLQKNGTAKVWWEEKTEKQTQTFGPIDDDAWMLAQQEVGDGEITAHTETEGLDSLKTHEYSVTRKIKTGKVRIEGLPPEEFLISKFARSIEESPYVAHRFRKRLSKLIEEGYDRKKVEALPTEKSVTADQTSEADTRRDNVEETQGVNEAHRTGVMREAWMVEEYVLVDWDDDGIAEYRKVLRASGTSGPILHHEEWDGPPPFISGVPMRMPHRFVGISVAELVMDLQLIKSQLIRQVIDNSYQHGHPEAVISDQVNLDDLLVTRLGKYTRLKPGAKPAEEHVRWLQFPFIGGQLLPVIEYLDSLKENRTGVTRYNQGMDADSLNKTARGIMQIMTASQQRIELIARIFAETAIKDLFWQILRCAQKYNTEPQMIRLRNKFVPMDPRQWSGRFDFSVAVGLGTGNRDQMLVHLQMLLQVLAQIVAAQGQFGVTMVTAKHIYNAVKKLINNMGEKAEEQFIQEPQPNQEPPPPDPKMMEVEAKAKLKADELEQKGRQAAAEIALDREERAVRIDMDREKNAQESALERERMDLERARMQQQVRLDRDKAQVKFLLDTVNAVSAMRERQQRAKQETAE